MSVYLISDTHFGETGTIGSFYSVDFNFSYIAYQVYIAMRWNSKIKDSDVVYIVGDAGDPNYFKDLNGHKILIRGNHDTYPEKYYRVFDKVVDNFIFEIHGIRVILEHILYSTEVDADIRIVGHSHNIGYYRNMTSEGKTIVYLLPNLLGYEPRNIIEFFDSKFHNWPQEFF